MAECGLRGDCPDNTGISIIQVPIRYTHQHSLLHGQQDPPNSAKDQLLHIVQTLLCNQGSLCSLKTTTGSFLFHIHNTYINLHVGEENYNLPQVRHPFERLVSAYRHLFLHGGWRLLEHSWEGDTMREEVSCDWWSLVT